DIREPVETDLDLRIARAIRLVVELGLVLHRDDHRHDVTHAPGARIAVKVSAIVLGRAKADGGMCPRRYGYRIGLRPEPVTHGRKLRPSQHVGGVLGATAQGQEREDEHRFFHLLVFPSSTRRIPPSKSARCAARAESISLKIALEFLGLSLASTAAA